MSKLNVYIDSSTRGQGGIKYGRSTAFWLAKWEEEFRENEPCRIGVYYNCRQGPNKIFFEGVIRALESCYSIGHRNCIIKIIGDCDTVIKILQREWTARDLAPFFSEVEKWEEMFRRNGKGTITYDYIDRDDEFYKKVHRCAKDFLNFWQQRFTQPMS
jgi:ribonuclease HI